MGNKTKSGITFAALLITMIIAIIMISTIVISYDSLKSSTRKKEFGKEIYTLQKLVERYNFEKARYPVVKDSSIEIILSEIEEDEKSQFASETGFSEGKITLAELDLYEAGADNISRGLKKGNNAKDIYVVSEKTGNVYYVKGEKINDRTYYMLTQQLKKDIGVTL